MRRHEIVRWCLGIMAGVLVCSGAVQAQQIRPNSRLLELPWVVIDRNTNQECTRLGPAQTGLSTEARRLADVGQAALDTIMHRHGMFTMVSRTEWEPYWKLAEPGTVLWQGAGCAVCTPVSRLLRYDSAALQQLGREVGADYIWLGVTVVPLTSEDRDNRPDECCREALTHERQEVLARSAALLVRVSDGKVVWQGDARRLTSDVRSGTPKRPSSPSTRREIAVKDTAHALGAAFAREHRQMMIAENK